MENLNVNKEITGRCLHCKFIANNLKYNHNNKKTIDQHKKAGKSEMNR